VRPITAGKCVCDGYIASTKVRPVIRTRDTGRAQDTDKRQVGQPIMVAGGERGDSLHPRRTRPQGPLTLKPPDLNMAIAKYELFIEKL